MAALLVALVGAAAWWAGREAPTESELTSGGSVGSTDDETEALAVPAQLPVVAPPDDRDASLPEPHPTERSEPLAITVVDATGAAVAGALVEVWDPPDRKDAVRAALEKSGLLKQAQGEVSEELAQQFVKAVRELVPDPTWDPPQATLRTGGDGRCELPDPTLTTILVASKEDVGTSGIWSVVPAPMTLRLQPMGHVHGVVKDAAGEPVPDATIRVSIPGWKLGEGGARTPRPLQSNERGEFELTVDAGAVGSATAVRGMPEEESSEDVFSVQAGETDEIVLLFAAGTISGFVAWDDGEPASRGTVSASLQGDGHWDSGADPTSRAWLGKDGSFRLDHLRPGRRYRVHVSVRAPASVAAERHDVETGATDVVLVLARKDSQGVTLRGRVVDMETGAPVTRFDTVVSYWSDGYRGQGLRTTKEAHENDDGRFELPRLPARFRWAVEIRADGYEPELFGPIRPADQQEFEFVIGRAGALSVEIVDIDGRPVAGARVELFKEVTLDGHDLASPERTAVTDAKGSLTWKSLPPGRRWLAATSAPGQLGPMSVTVPSGGTGSVRGQLDGAQAAGSISVHVIDREGAALPGADVFVVIKNGTGDEDETPIPTDSSGMAVAQDLRPGVYAVSVHADAHWILPHYFVVEPGSAVRVELRP